MKLLDFLIIGAQKSGTTTLFKLLSQHSSIYMPPEKEAPFFSLDERYERGWDWYTEEFFKNAPKNLLWGKASPQYMTDNRVPARIAELMPEVKLIAILREPVSRAYSHYKMLVRRGKEERSFEEAIQQQLIPENLEKSREYPEEENCYIVWGEYGRILSNFLQYFSKSQMLILFMDDLASRPDLIMIRLYEFLGISKELPKHLNKKFHQGGTRQRLPYIKSIVKKTPLNILWYRVPFRYKRRLRYWFNQWNVLHEEDNNILLSSKTFNKLSAHYNNDFELIKKVIYPEMPHWN